MASFASAAAAILPTTLARFRKTFPAVGLQLAAADPPMPAGRHSVSVTALYASFAALSVGQPHNWFGIPPEAANQTTALWLGSWLLVIGLLTVLTVRLPWTYPVLFAVVDIALVLLLIGTLAGSAAAARAGGWVIFVFAALVGYFYVASLWEETGGRALPLGRPLLS